MPITAILTVFLVLIAGADYMTATIMLTFTPSGNARLCSRIRIIDDNVGSEPNEEFSVKLISASPLGTIGEDTSCVTIIDDDRKFKKNNNNKVVGQLNLLLQSVWYNYLPNTCKSMKKNSDLLYNACFITFTEPYCVVEVSYSWTNVFHTLIPRAYRLKKRAYNCTPIKLNSNRTYK